MLGASSKQKVGSGQKVSGSVPKGSSVDLDLACQPLHQIQAKNNLRNTGFTGMYTSNLSSILTEQTSLQVRGDEITVALPRYGARIAYQRVGHGLILHSEWIPKNTRCLGHFALKHGA